MTTLLRLEDAEIAALDGKCCPETQKEVDAAIQRLRSATAYPTLPIPLAGFIADAVAEAKSQGELVFRHLALDYCKGCSKAADYVRYKSGRNRGQPNYSRKIRFGGVELAKRFIHLEGSATLGVCHDCWKIVQPALACATNGLQAEIPEAITGRPPQYRRYDNRECKRCGWVGHEGEMGRLRTLFGDGTYAGACPQCKAEDHGFGETLVERADGFTVVPAA